MKLRGLFLVLLLAALGLGAEGCPQQGAATTSGSATAEEPTTTAAEEPTTTTADTSAGTVATESGYSMTDDGRMLHPDGRIQKLDVSGYPMFDAEGNPVWEPPPEEQAKQLFEEAVMLQKGIAGAEPNEAGALERLTRAVELVPDFAEAWYNLGRLQLKLNSLESAKSSLKKAIQLDAENMSAYLALGLAMERAGELSPAIIQYQKGLQVQPENVDLLNGVARIIRKQGKTAQAIDKARAILRVNSNSLDAYNTLGLCYLDQGELELARFVFLKAEASVPGGDESASIQANMGLVFFKMDKEYAAEERFNRARTIDPDHVGAMVNLAYLKLKNYDFEGARALLEQAERVLPASNEIQLDLAVSYRGTGEHDRARGIYEKIVDADDHLKDEALLNLGILLADHYKDHEAALTTYEHYKVEHQAQGGVIGDDHVIHGYVKESDRAVEREKKRKEREAKKKAREAKKAAEKAAEEAAASGESGGTENPGTSDGAGGQ